MRGGDLLDNMELADPKYAEAAENAHRSDRPNLWKLTALAASIAIVALGAFVLTQFDLLKSTEQRTGEMGGSTGITYMSYAGPVFPLTIEAEDGEITAERDIIYDFSPFETKKRQYTQPNGKKTAYTGFDSATVVTDSFLLDNSSDSDKTVTLIYPFAGSLTDKPDIIPTVTVDGEQVSTSLEFGDYAGKFVGTADPYNVGTYNLAMPTSWEDYRELIDSGYMSTAFDGYPELTQPVTVYEVTGKDGLWFEYYNDDSAAILSDEFNSYDFDRSTGLCKKGLNKRADSGLVVVMNGDISDPKVIGEGSFERRETTLGDVFRRIAGKYYDVMTHEYADGSIVTSVLQEVPVEDYTGLAAELLVEYGLISDQVKDRYADGRLDELMREAASVDRIMYATFETVIPAHGTVTVSAEMVKYAGFDFVGEHERRCGFDLVTSLGSNLTFTRQTAGVTNTEYVEFLSNSFGFDPDSGMYTVELDLNEPYYYMDVKKSGER